MTEEMVVLFHTMDGDKERWIKDYSVLVDCMYAALNSGLRMTVPKAEQRLGLKMEAISADIMLANAKHSLERGFVLKTKEMVYYHILQYLQLEETNPDFNKANVSDLVLYIIGPIIAEFNRKTGCKLRSRRKKKIISTNNGPGGIEEFVVMDRTPEKDNRFVLVVGAGGGGEAMK